MNPIMQNLSDPTMCSANTEDMSRAPTLVSIPTSLTIPPDNENQPTTTTKHSFFYRPYNDFEMYHITCKEVPITFNLVSWLINNSDHYYDQSNCTYVFYHEQTDSKIILEITCKMVSHQFLNKMIYNI